MPWIAAGISAAAAVGTTLYSNSEASGRQQDAIKAQQAQSGSVGPALGQAATAGAGLLVNGAANSRQQGIIGAAQDKAVGALAPYADTGAPATRALSDFAGLNGPDAANNAMAMFHSSPGYQFQLDQGLRAVDSAGASKGLERSGPLLQAEQAFGQGLANQDFGNYLNRLSGYAGQGLQAAGNQAQTFVSGATQQAGLVGQGAANTNAGIGQLAGAVVPSLAKYLGNSGSGSVYGTGGLGDGKGYGTVAGNSDIWGGNTLSGYSAPSGTGTDAFAGNTLGGFY